MKNSCLILVTYCMNEMYLTTRKTIIGCALPFNKKITRIINRKALVWIYIAYKTIDIAKAQIPI